MYRTRSTASNPDHHLAVFTNSSGAYSQTSWESNVKTSTMTDVNHPNWKQEISEGKIVSGNCSKVSSVTNEFNGFRSSRQNSTGSWFQTTDMRTFADDIDPNWSSQLTYSNGIPPSLASKDLDHYIRLAKQQCLSRIDSSPNNMMEDLFEFKKTFSTLKNPMNSVRSISKKLSKLDSRALSNAWLSARFEYGSLIYSAMSIADVTNRLQNGLQLKRENFRQRTVSSPHGFEESLYNTVTGKHVSLTPGATVVYTQVDKISFSVIAGCIYGIRKRDRDFNWYSGLRLKNAPRGVWNILPYTWVTDRFFDVSSMIQGSLNLLDPNVDILYAWVNIKSANSRERTVVSMSFPGYTQGATGTHIFQSDSFSRTQWWPRIADTLPTFDVGTLSDMKHDLDYASLILNRVGSVLSKKK